MEGMMAPLSKEAKFRPNGDAVVEVEVVGDTVVEVRVVEVEVVHEQSGVLKL